MARSTTTQKTERINAAYGLLASGVSLTEACMSLSRRFALSRRQAYRYLQEAQHLATPLPLTEPTVAVTFKLPPSIVDQVRARATVNGKTISETVAQALVVYLAASSDHGRPA